MLCILVLVVQFTSGQFSGSESSGFIEVVVRITGGTSGNPITVTVTPSVQSPVSAMGMYWLSLYCNDHYVPIGSGIDFNSNPFTITINAGATEGRANISVTCDDEVEGSETFDMTLTLTSSTSGVTLGRDTCEGVINDSTGNGRLVMVLLKTISHSLTLTCEWYMLANWSSKMF